MEKSIEDKIDQILKTDAIGNKTSIECLLEECPNIKSPVEKLFYCAWSLTPLHQIGLTPQYRIKDFYIDFKVSFIDYFVNSPIKYSYQELLKIEKLLPLYAIEIDGHDFHEKTKAQVQKDKQRERVIVSQGYKVLRFSGSEVFHNTSTCVVDCFYAYQKDFHSAIRKIQYLKGHLSGLD